MLSTPTRGTHRRAETPDRSTELKRAPASGATDDQILHLFCHAEAAGLNTPGGPDESCLVMSDTRVTLGKLDIDASTDTPLRGKPLVFNNACKSAQLSPAFNDGFVPHFLTKGARCVMGIDCLTPLELLDRLAALVPPPPLLRRVRANDRLPGTDNGGH